MVVKTREGSSRAHRNRQKNTPNKRSEKVEKGKDNALYCGRSESPTSCGFCKSGVTYSKKGFG